MIITIFFYRARGTRTHDGINPLDLQSKIIATKHIALYAFK